LVVQIATPEKEYGAFLEKLGLENPVFEEKLTFDAALDAMSEESVAIASVEGWTSVWGVLLFVDEEVKQKLSKKANLLEFTLEGASDSYLFEWWTKGALKRKRFIQEGEVQIDIGKPLPEEVEAFEEEDDEEERIFELIDRLCLPFRKLTMPKFHVFQIDG